MPVNFLRKARVIIGKDEAIQITSHRIKFELTKSRVQYPNSGIITIYNLSNDTRQQIEEEHLRIILETGYGDGSVMHRTFVGDVRNVFHRREGADIASDIYVGDGDAIFQNATVNETIPSDSSPRGIIDILVGTMEGIDIGTILDFSGDSTRRPSMLAGNTKDELDKIALKEKAVWSIQDGVFEMMPVDQFVKEDYVISAENGMLGTPVVTEDGVKVKTQLAAWMLPNRSIKVFSKYIDQELQNLVHTKRDTDLGGGQYVINTITLVGDTRGSDWYNDIDAKRIYDEQVTR